MSAAHDHLIDDIVAGLEITEPDDWADVDLTLALTGEGTPAPSIGQRSDGRGLFYAGKVNTLFGEPSAGKGWVVLVTVAERLEIGEDVIYVDFEDSAESVVGRLLLLGVDPSTILEQFHYKRPDTAIGGGLVPLVDEAAGCSLVVLDGVTEAMALHGMSGDKNADVATFHASLPRPIAATGPAVITIDHVVKARENRNRWATGGAHKLALVDGAAYAVEAIKPFARDSSGVSRLVVSKDRNGHWRQGEHATELKVTAGEHNRFELVAPESIDADGNFRPTTLMARCSEWLAMNPGRHSTNKITEAVSGQNEAKRQALKQLAREGFARTHEDGQAVLYEHLDRFHAT